MNSFDKICAGIAFAIGISLLVLGALGAFFGCSANFTLPPVIGVLPAFAGWGIVRAVFVAWSVPRSTRTDPGSGSSPRRRPDSWRRDGADAVGDEGVDADFGEDRDDWQGR